MKQYLNLFLIMCAVAVFGFVASCNARSAKKVDVVETPVTVSLNVQKYMDDDYAYLVSQYDTFHFYEVDIHFNKTIDNMDAAVDGVNTVFQHGDTCITFIHTPEGDDTVYSPGYHWGECLDIEPRNNISFEGCMTIVKDLREGLPTQSVTFRRPLYPPYPEYGWWIFGNGMYAIDSETGNPIQDIREEEGTTYEDLLKMLMFGV